MSIIKFSGKEKKIIVAANEIYIGRRFDLISFWILLSLFSSFLYCFILNYRFCILSRFLVLFMISVRQKRVSDRLRELNQRVLECLSVVHAFVGLIIIALNSRQKLHFFTFSVKLSLLILFPFCMRVFSFLNCSSYSYFSNVTKKILNIITIAPM